MSINNTVSTGKKSNVEIEYLSSDGRNWLHKIIIKIMSFLGFTSGIGFSIVGFLWFFISILAHTFSKAETYSQLAVKENYFNQAEMGLLIASVGILIMAVQKLITTVEKSYEK